MHSTEPGLAPVTDGDPLVPVDSTGPAEAEKGQTGFTALRDEVSALVEDARTYAEAELAFQKTRAGLAGRHGVRAIGLIVLALVLFHIALIALAVGVVIALAPYVTIWGAIAIVVGVLLLAVALLVRAAQNDGRIMSAMFGSGDAS